MRFPNKPLIHQVIKLLDRKKKRLIGSNRSQCMLKKWIGKMKLRVSGAQCSWLFGIKSKGMLTGLAAPT